MTPNLNAGQRYEAMIRSILENRNLLPQDLHGNDAGFIHRGQDYYIEIKNRTAPDFGQKRILWDEQNGWHWAIVDSVTDLFDELNLLDRIVKTFIPRRYSKDTNQITIADRRYNQERFEQNNILIDDIEVLYDYYARKECYYIQIENKGFYYLLEDRANLGVPHFRPQLKLRLRAKTHHSDPPYQYSFFAVIQAIRSSIDRSTFDLEEKVGSFPNITP
ncbi:hypothetical protein HQ587_04855 [bacterium]|nr:hypothetical protein [bacterium]